MTVWTQIRLLLKEQTDLGSLCLLLYLVSNVRQLFAADNKNRQHFQMHFYLLLMGCHDWFLHICFFLKMGEPVILIGS